MYDVAIIGGGVVGGSIARELARYHVRTVLLEREAEVGFGTTKTNSGIIHAGHHSSPDTLKGRLVVRGNRLFDRLHQELGFGFRRIGELVVAMSEAELEVLDDMAEVARVKGVPVERWDRDRLRREEPNLSHSLKGALYAPTAGVINPYEFAFALLENAMANGVELRVNSPVTGLTDRGDHLQVRTPNESLRARYVLNCAGVFADRVAGLLGLDDFSIHPRKGEEYMLDAGLKGLVRRLIFPVPGPVSKGTLIIPTFDGTIMVGPTATDTDDRYDVTTTPEGAHEVFSAVRALCPSIDERATIAEFAGLRAASDTGDFIIGPTAVRGFVNVAGIQSPGLTSAPAIAEYVLEILGQQGLRLVERGDFEPRVPPPARFAHQSVARQRELAAADPLHGRVVCRCETVTEAEVRRAVDRGARTLDGVKFRTRAGMGRCQGGFCTTGVLQILSERLGVPIEAVTKRGRGSWIVTPMDAPGASPPATPSVQVASPAEEV